MIYSNNNFPSVQGEVIVQLELYILEIGGYFDIFVRYELIHQHTQILWSYNELFNRQSYLFHH